MLGDFYGEWMCWRERERETEAEVKWCGSGSSLPARVMSFFLLVNHMELVHMRSLRKWSCCTECKCLTDSVCYEAAGVSRSPVGALAVAIKLPYITQYTRTDPYPGCDIIESVCRETLWIFREFRLRQATYSSLWSGTSPLCVQA